VIFISYLLLFISDYSKINTLVILLSITIRLLKNIINDPARIHIDIIIYVAHGPEGENKQYTDILSRERILFSIFFN